VDEEPVIEPAAVEPTAEPLESSRPVDRFRRTAAGSIVAAGLFGLRDALEGRPERDQIAVVADAPTREQDGPVEVVLDFERPGHGIVVLRRPSPPSDPD
jgi:hypothetical protein